MTLTIIAFGSPLWTNSKGFVQVPINSCAGRIPILRQRTGSNNPVQFYEPSKTCETEMNERARKYINALGNVDEREYAFRRQWYLHSILFPFLVHELSCYQHANGVQGAVGEIGVHYGGFFLGIATAALKSEKLFAVDIFDNQELNVDGSGKGNLDIFKANCIELGIPFEDVGIIKNTSTSVNDLELLNKTHGSIRMLSIDGGHTREATCHDMNLGDALLHDGGIIIVDDVGCCRTKTDTWSLGVIDGVHTFFGLDRDLQPFFFAPPKMFFARSAFAAKFRTFLREKFNDFLGFEEATLEFGTAMHASRYTIFDGEVLQLGKIPNESQILANW
eukprot:CAMPEP_0184490034 /NCGR_PEP_ID=MMETSP0113_2-20130426/16977_1 /TAXON_ID=91329 /ORGANISM="Norrisiella sphaerica, Strain BC52" /LENGTH=332 /DNA_ID=CAMNT_0026873761 /DNA_START=150 /DNA_END=1145 /DNA_ORIENTATION=+